MTDFLPGTRSSGQRNFYGKALRLVLPIVVQNLLSATISSTDIVMLNYVDQASISAVSLAVNYSPDDIGFFLIDYKGGGMANLFEGLPHMIGQISNLSGNQVKRAMISIKSENRRRQRIFNENG